MSTLTRYLLFQVPGWLLAAVVVVALWHWVGVRPWVAVALFLGWLAKDFALYPLLRHAYERQVKTGAELLVGMVGVARGHLAPQGYVFIRGELWRAQVEGSGTIPPGSRVRVHAARGLTLIVTNEEEDTRPSPQRA